MQVTWLELKNFIDSRNLSVQWIELFGRYRLIAFDGPFSLETSILKSDPPSEDQLDFETNYKENGNQKIDTGQVSVISEPPPVPLPPFAAKIFESRKLFKRIHGISSSVVSGSNDIVFTIPYPWVKLTGLEAINGEPLDTVSLFVLDSITGTYTTIPGYILNQFGFTVNVSKDYYSYKSEFDADLYQGMQILIVYKSVSSKTVGINFVLNEVK